jgi:hypothetical protein
VVVSIISIRTDNDQHARAPTKRPNRSESGDIEPLRRGNPSPLAAVQVRGRCRPRSMASLRAGSSRPLAIRS